SKRSPAGAPVGTALLLSNRPRYRMGFRRASRFDARRQRQRHVHRIRGPPVDWGRLFGQSAAGISGPSGLPRAESRAGTRYGRFSVLPERAANLSGIAEPVVAIRQRVGTGGLTLYSPA